MQQFFVELFIIGFLCSPVAGGKCKSKAVRASSHISVDGTASDVSPDENAKETTETMENRRNAEETTENRGNVAAEETTDQDEDAQEIIMASEIGGDSNKSAVNTSLEESRNSFWDRYTVIVSPQDFQRFGGAFGIGYTRYSVTNRAGGYPSAPKQVLIISELYQDQGAVSSQRKVNVGDLWLTLAYYDKKSGRKNVQWVDGRDDGLAKKEDWSPDRPLEFEFQKKEAVKQLPWDWGGVVPPELNTPGGAVHGQAGNLFNLIGSTAASEPGGHAIDDGSIRVGNPYTPAGMPQQVAPYSPPQQVAPYSGQHQAPYAAYGGQQQAPYGGQQQAPYANDDGWEPMIGPEQ